jgi:Dolichyl-phosphate-mannose-protein mannosyltransferase
VGRPAPPGQLSVKHEAELPAFARRPVLAIAFAIAALELAVSWRYGYHRDELYFLEAGHHLAFGYVDQPPFAPLVGRLSTLLFGNTPTALRVFPALSLGAVTFLAGAITRELGGTRYPQVLAAVAVGLAGEFVGSSHLLSTTPFDVLAWVALSFVVIRIIRTGNERLWIAAGLIAGAGLEDKWTIAFFTAALAVGFLATAERRWFRSPWLWAGVGIALALWLPNLLWQASHGWPVAELDRNLHSEAIDDGNLYTFIPAQLIYVGPLAAPIWIAGLVRLWGGPYRCFTIAYGVLFVFFLVTLGKPYYIGPIYGVLLSAGAIATADWIERRQGWLTERRVLAAVVIAGVIALPLALPVVPARTLHSVELQSINYDLGEQIGWPHMVGQIAAAYDSLPPGERSRAVVFASNYGEAGAVDRYGGGDLPQAYSGHNSYWLWGPPPGRTPALLVGFRRRYLHRYFTGLRRVGTLSNGLGVSDDELGAPIWTARSVRGSWATQWPRLQHYN